MTSYTNHKAITQLTLPFSYLQLAHNFLFGFNHISRVVLDNLTKTHLVKSTRAGTHNVACIMWDIILPMKILLSLQMILM